MKNIDFTDFFNVFLSGATIKGLDFCIIINSQSEDFPFNTLPSPESTQYVPKKKYELPRVSNRSNDSLDLKTAIAYP